MASKDVIIIGGGSAGLAAAIQLKKEGINNILILEKNENLGGILNQCIHSGFGLTEFKEELTGPEYYWRFVKEAINLGVDFKLNTMVTNISKDKIVTYQNRKEGVVEVQAKAIIFATGCYERGAGAIQIPGDRVSGIITAGTAQKYLNIHGYLVGKRIVILGSGDIGLIMARRLTLEGAKVLCVSEIMPYSNGLNRNIAQCLNDYNIPLYLSRSVSKVIGKSRVEKVILSAVDEHMQFIPGTEMEFECDTLLLSIGLVPYTMLLNNLDLAYGPRGIKVNQNLETSLPGLFVCGNCLHVHDVVDFVSDEGRAAGHGAALYIKNLLPKQEYINVLTGDNLLYVLPHIINFDNDESITFKFRVKKPMQNVNVVFKVNNDIIASIPKPVVIPSEMILIKVEKSQIKLQKGQSITVSVEEK